MTEQVWYHPSCSKSNRALAELDAAGGDYQLRDYVDQPPSVAELAQLAGRLGLPPWEFCRTTEPVAAELGLADWPRDDEHRDRWFAAMSANPILIQRPIVVRGDRAVIAREAGWRAAFDD